MKKNILITMAIGCMLIGLVATPNLLAQSRNETINYESIEANLKEGTYIDNGIFYDTALGFSFIIPPAWKENFAIFQFHNSTTFMLNRDTTGSEDFLITISAFDTNGDADYYHVIPEDFEDNFTKLYELDNIIYAYKIHKINFNSKVDSNLLKEMLIPLNGVEDLFNLY